MHPVPRPPPSVPLGGSLRASRAAQLALPEGPLAAVDLADGRALLVALRDGEWAPVEGGSAVVVTPPAVRPEPEAALAAVPGRRRRLLGPALAFAAAFAAAAVALGTGFSPAPSPAAAGDGVRIGAPFPPSAPRPRGGRALRLPAARAAPPPPAPAAPSVPVTPGPPPPAAAPPPPAPPPPPPLPALPSVPAL